MKPLSLPSPWVIAQAEQWAAAVNQNTGPNDTDHIKTTILDFAAGRGRHSRALAATYPFDILAVDRNADALAELAAACPQISVLIHDLEAPEDWPFARKQFDVVVVTNYLFRPRLGDLFQLVAPGGYLAYETFGVGNAAFGRPKNPDFLLEPDELGSLLPADFTIIDYFHGKIETPHPAIIHRLAARRTAWQQSAP